jgi:hypothetical protein
VTDRHFQSSQGQSARRILVNVDTVPADESLLNRHLGSGVSLNALQISNSQTNRSGLIAARTC